MIGVDIETTGLSPYKDKIIGIGVGNRFITPLIGDITLLVGNKAAYHNGKFDLKFLPHGTPYTFDTMLAASVLLDRPESLSLDSLAAYYLGEDSWKELNRKKMASYPIEEVAAYCLKDVSVTERLVPVLTAKLKAEGMTEFFETRLMPAARLLLDVERRGIGIDVERTESKLQDITLQIAELEQALTCQWGQRINWNSPKQLLTLLNKNSLSLTSTAEAALLPFSSHPGIKLLLSYREAIKLRGFLESWLDNAHQGRIHPTYNLANTRTGRLSCSDPNLQQVPRDKSIRELFVPRPGTLFIIADYAQIEPRVVAHYSQDARLLETFTNDIDFYGTIARSALGATCAPNDVAKLHPQLRQLAKVVGLSVLYGCGRNKLCETIRRAGFDMTEAKAGQIINSYFRNFAALKQLQNRIIKQVEAGIPLKNHYGRRFRIDPDYAFSKGVNTLIQSSASDACLFSQLRFANDPRAQLVAIIHDEVIYEADPETSESFARDLEAEMTNQGFTCPLKLEYKIGRSWADK